MTQLASLFPAVALRIEALDVHHLERIRTEIRQVESLPVRRDPQLARECADRYSADGRILIAPDLRRIEHGQALRRAASAKAIPFTRAMGTGAVPTGGDRTRIASSAAEAPGNPEPSKASAAPLAIPAKPLSLTRAFGPIG